MTDRWRWKALATYNAEVARGIVHTPAYDALMEVEQERFDQKQRIDAGVAPDPTPPDPGRSDVRG